MTIRQIVSHLLRRKSFYCLLGAYSIIALLVAPFAERSSLVMPGVALVVAVTFVPYVMKIVSNGEGAERKGRG